ncbi:helix-turn-helix domain-containing protein [Paroceanicella profunda]|uniref:Helix-turn-helix domain-containing protein n=2 Tax=Paroceanicella profunda TaxID=2579971 RepID=A0A5B8G2V8_9RHOB|nr:helix-turn-helix domain-containing protein [Paroceanicella profunda]
MGVEQGTVSRLENGRRRLTLEFLIDIATALGCRVADLIEDDRSSIAVAGRVGAGAQVPLVDAYAKGEGLYQVTCPRELSPHGIVAVEVEGDSMAPTYQPGDVLFYRRETHEGVPTEAINHICVCEGMDGNAWVKVVKQGTEPGLFHLISVNMLAENQFNIALKWAARVRLSLPADLVEKAL